jgi:hypothetical protein
MATKKQTDAAKRNIQKAQAVAKSKRTLANLPAGTKHDLGKQGARARARGGSPGRALEERSRSDLYKLAQKEKVQGRSRMGKWELIDALRSSR